LASPVPVLTADSGLAARSSLPAQATAPGLGQVNHALSSGVVTRVNVDWAAFDPNVTLFSTVDAALRLPDDQLDEPLPEARLFPAGTVSPTLRP